MKKHCYSEIAYLLGLLILALGTALMEKAGFGMSMVVAPAYLLHLKISETIPFFSFGMAEYTFQAVLILVLILIQRRFRLSYLFSFFTAVLYGFTLDGAIWLATLLPALGTAGRLLYFFIGMLLCSIGVSLLFHTYLSPEAYELFVKEMSGKYHIEIHLFKTGYDCISCLVSVALSFAFFGFGQFRGVQLGTIFCALVNGWLISQCSHFLEKNVEFSDCLSARGFFERS